MPRTKPSVQHPRLIRELEQHFQLSFSVYSGKEWIHCEPDLLSHCRKIWLTVTKSRGSGSHSYFNIYSEDYTAYQGVTNRFRQSCPPWGQMFLRTPALCSRSCLIPSTLPTSTSADFLNSHFIEAFLFFILTWWWKRPGKAQISLRKYHRTPPCPKSWSIISSISFFSCNPENNSDPQGWWDQFSSSSWHLPLWPKHFCQKQCEHRFWSPLASPTCLIPPRPGTAMISHLTVLTSVIKWAEYEEELQLHFVTSSFHYVCHHPKQKPV